MYFIKKIEPNQNTDPSHHHQLNNPHHSDSDKI